MTSSQIKTSLAVTAAHDFWPATAAGEKLFSVRAGIPLHHAFDELSSLLSSSMSVIEVHATRESDDLEGVPEALWETFHLMKFAYALTQSMHHGYNQSSP